MFFWTLLPPLSNSPRSRVRYRSLRVSPEDNYMRQALIKRELLVLFTGLGKCHGASVCRNDRAERRTTIIATISTYECVAEHE